jgi:nucleotide-binding universal stress UspA family protein
LIFGTSEETYLAIYAAGVFILLSMTGWAASKRLLRSLRAEFTTEQVLTLIGAAIAALLTTGATFIIFQERFLEGAWTYFVLVPILYAVFTYFRRTLGVPSQVKEQLGELEAAMLGGFGLGQSAPAQSPEPYVFRPAQAEWQQPTPSVDDRWQGVPVALQQVLVPLDGSPIAEQVLPMAETICRAYQASMTLVSVLQPHDWSRFLPTTQDQEWQITESERAGRETYLGHVVERLHAGGNSLEIDYVIGAGPVADQINTLACNLGADLVVMSTSGRYGAGPWMIGSVASKMVQLTNRPTLLIPPLNGNGKSPQLKRLLVTLDGSEFAERVLPYARAFASQFDSQVLLLSVPEVPETWMYGAMGEVVEGLRAETEARTCQYLEPIAATFYQEGLEAQPLITGSGPARTIVSVSESESVDMIMLATHGLGGKDRLFVGSVADRVVQNTRRPVFLVPIQERRPLSPECEPEPALIHDPW